MQTVNNIGNSIFITTNGRQAAAINKLDGRIIWTTDIVDDIRKTALEATEAAKTSKEMAITKPKSESSPKNIFGKMMSKIASYTTKEKPTRNLGYDRSKLRPIDFVSSILMNDLFTLYTSKGSIYYLSPLDGTILDQKNLKTDLNFVVISSKVVLVSGKKILLSQ